MKICFIPIDNRPVCYSLAKDICAIDNDIELYIPSRECLGDLKKNADIEAIFNWLNKLPQVDAMILSLDTLAYGGLIPTRRCPESFEEIKERIDKLKPILKGKKVYAFSSIMRISNNNFNEEEKEYWKEYGKEIFRISFETDKNGYSDKNNLPQEIFEDYIKTRDRNFEINKLYLEWQTEGLFDTLIFSKDDCAEFGFNVREAVELEKLGGKTKTGADEIPLTLLARAIEKDIKVYPMFIEPEYKDCISNYEDVSIEKSVLGQLELGGFKVVNSEEEADIVLVVNNFMEKQGELVMNWSTKLFNGNFTMPQKPYAVADVRYANGADNEFIKELFKNNLPQYGYAGWNTSANSIGSLLAGVKVKFEAKKYNDLAYKKLQLIRFLDDWAYQANIRAKIQAPCDIKEFMKPYENVIIQKLSIKKQLNIGYSFPWRRKFEVEVCIN